MTYDEFHDKLQKMKIKFKKRYGKDMETIKELEMFLDRRLIEPKSRAFTAAKSLKGLFGG